MPQLLIELFSEEIPARMQGNAARDLERMARERLTEAGFPDPRLRTFAGPRRLTLVVDDLPAAQADRSEEVKGPRTSAPPQALEGFLRKTGLIQDQLTERDGAWFAQISTKGRPTAEIIAEMVDHIVRNFPWPKSMKWGTGTLRWVRPLQRILCVFDGAVVPVDIDGIKSANLTEGHRFMGDEYGAFAVTGFDDYREALARRFVVLDVADRKARILDGARNACAATGVELVEDEGLLEEVAGLAEWPVPVLGDMDPTFLDLPPEVIRTSMRTHQKYFAVRKPGEQGLAPHFLVVANIDAIDGGKALAAGNARVLSARLNDAEFFWDEDNKPGNFDRWLEKLNGVTFHAKLGTMAQRVERIAALAREIAPSVGADPAKAETAARYAKADLASGMVGEFPELQGVMGGYYADRAQLDPAVADAIRSHYKPQGPSDAVPTAPVSVSVALADKLDTLIGFFAIDEKPTGSKDPYALRRAALGVLRTVISGQHRISILPLLTIHWRRVDKSYGLTTNSAVAFVTDATGVRADARHLLTFLADRLKVLLRDQGKRHDLVDAVFALGDDDLVRIVAERVEALDEFLKSDNGIHLLAGYKRANNILKSEEKKRGSLPAGAPRHDAIGKVDEDQLVAQLSMVIPNVDAALAREDYVVAMQQLATLRGPLDGFFERVLVIDPNDIDGSDNRLRLLLQVRKLMEQVADFSQISG